MGASRTTTTQDSTSTSTPTAAPEIQFGLDQNRNLFNTLQGRTFPDFSTVAQFSDPTQAGLNATIDRGLAGSPVNEAAQGAITDIASNGIFGPGGVPTNAAAEFFLPTARGDFLDFGSNPAFLRGVENINDTVGSIFERAGRTGSGANQSAVSRGVGDFAAGIFNNERSNQLNASSALANIFQGDINNQAVNTQGQLSAAGLAPGLAATDFADLQAVLGAGNAFDNQNQRLIDDQINRFNFPFDNAIQAQQLLNAGVGGLGPLLGGTNTGSSTSVQEQSGGLLNSILGGALTAGSLFAGGGGGFGGLFGGNSSASSGGFSPTQIASSIIPPVSTAPVGGFNLFGGVSPFGAAPTLNIPSFG